MTDKVHSPDTSDITSTPALEIRALRFLIAAVLVIATLMTLRMLLGAPIIDANKLEVGLLLGWLIAKSGTVIDWLFGGSEGGARRADALVQGAAEPRTVRIDQPADRPVPVEGQS